MALPLRQPTILAKEIATLDFLSGGRVLPAIGLGTEDEREYEAAGVARADRAARTDEMVEVMRLLWSGEPVTYRGRFSSLTDVSVQPTPVRPELPPIWVGGRSAEVIVSESTEHPNSAWGSAAGEWHKNWSEIPGEDADPYNAQAFGVEAPWRGVYDDGFAELATEVWNPVFRAEGK